jgi:hypothetical protein
VYNNGENPGGRTDDGAMEMVDRKARDKLAEALRHLISCRITNEQYVDRTEGLLSSKDKTVREIFSETYWLYDDYKEHKLDGGFALGKDARHEIARYIVFLHPDLEYEWPNLPISASGCSFVISYAVMLLSTYGIVRVPPIWQVIAGIVSAGGICIMALRCFLRESRTCRYLWNVFHWLTSRIDGLVTKMVVGPVIANLDIWPFIKPEDLEAALEHPRLLSGNARREGRVIGIET